MRVGLDLREHDVSRRCGVLVVVGTGVAAAIPGKAEVLASLGDAVEFARGNGVTHAVDLIVSEPQSLVLRVEVHAHRVAHAVGVNHTIRAIALHRNDAANANRAILVKLFLARHVEGLAQRNIQAVIGPDAADAGSVVVGLFFNRDQLALLDDRHGNDVIAFIEILGGRIDDDAVALGNVEEAVLREADAMRNLHVERSGEQLHVIRHARLAAVRQSIDMLLTG